jgi:hypothetical protein
MRISFVYILLDYTYIQTFQTSTKQIRCDLKKLGIFSYNDNQNHDKKLII